MSLEEKLGHLRLSREQLRCILSIFVNISLTLLPIYASDYPLEDRRKFYKLLMQWTRRTPIVIDHYLSLFKNGGPVTMKAFIEGSAQYDVFNVLAIREVAKRTAVITDNNVNQVKDSQQSDRELFGGRLNQDELNDDLEEDLTDVPSIFAEAVLYKVV
mmetsp:Transcript_30591/g.37736  ORF Transcript_30591/g.37736 Transcript_30591/m.37736 type:complete len:158 (+) Transcript_30591:610-1083(+)